MSKSYKVALAVDAVDYWIIEKDIDAIENITKADLHESVVTPDNTYLCVYWDDICWDMMQVRPLLKKLESFRHALITISEEGEIWKDIEESDSRGTDEEFQEVLSWNADICFWDNGAPLSPVCPYSPKFSYYMPISRERVIQILSQYVDNDLNATETGYIYDALTLAGATHNEIEALGFGYCISEENI